MTNPVEKKIYGLSAACSVLAISSFVVPRFVGSSDNGFASAATAIVVLLALLLLTLIVSIYALAYTLRAPAEISTLPKIAGIAPAVIVGVLFVGLLLFLSY